MGDNLSQIEFHQGEALLAIAGTYPSLADVISEAVQNALDVEAVNISVFINHRNRTVTVSDDGIGVSKSQFERALKSVCYSRKDESKLGKYGRGLVAPLGKCEKFTFTSMPKSQTSSSGYIRWTFETAVIQGQAKIAGVPYEEVTGQRFSRNPKNKKEEVPWRTQVKLIGFTKDRVLSRVTCASLREGLLERFSVAMRKRNASVSIQINDASGASENEKVVANEFEGRALPVEYLDNDLAGKTTFRIFIAKKTSKGRRGKILVGEAGKDFRISFSDFSRNTVDLLDREIIDALSSGLFEGEFITEKATLSPTRKYFEVNDALVSLCLVIEDWYRRIGEEHARKIREEAKDQRLQLLGVRSMKVIETMLGLPQFDFLKEVVKGFKIGTVGVRHTKPSVKVVGKQPDPSISTLGAQGGKAERDKDGGRGTNDPGHEHPEHMPFTVRGPRGRERTAVKGNSLGLQFLYVDELTWDKLWDLDTTTGVLTFNTVHPLWSECERDEKSLMRFQEHITITALMLETVPDSWKDIHRRLVDDSMSGFVFWLMQGDKLAGRKPDRRIVPKAAEIKSASKSKVAAAGK
ncbi:MAG: ATP-binding protein [Candidatus Magasanikbacteria bacterium]|nr:ATP-binding protein [Candidatus Magasanikbacteria bacterium]